MSDLDNYYTTIKKLVNSLVIKIDEIRIHQNYHFFVKKGLIPPSLEESKYYQNISGMLNNFDYEVMWNDTPLTREYLNNNLYLKNTLLYNDDVRNALIKDNPGMSDYIRGCALDITMDEFIALDNYTVISYNNLLLNENELSIVSDIEDYVRMVMTRYNNREYMMEEYYLPLLLNTLYSTLVTYLVSKKYGNMCTISVDNFHIENKLNSYKSLYTQSNVFNLSTNIWLYGNIDRIKHRVGTNYTLDTVTNEILDKNKIGIAEVDLVNKLPILLEDNVLDVTKEYYDADYVFRNIAINSSCYNISGTDNDNDSIVDLLSNNNLLTNINLYNSYKETTLLKSTTNTYKTKYFLLDTPEKIRTYYTNNFVFSISNLFYMVNGEDYLFTVDYLNIKNSRIYNLSMSDVEMLVAYMLMELYGIDGSITIDCRGIFDIDNINKTTILSRTWYKNDLSKIYDYLIDIVGLDQYVYNHDTFKLNIEAKREIESRGWFVLSNSIDNTIVADVSVILESLFTTMDFTYDKDTCYNYILSNGLETFINTVDYELLVDLLSVVTGLTLDPTHNLLEDYNKIQLFHNKLTSYTMSLLIDKNFTDKNIVNNITNGVNIGYKPFIDIKNFDYELYDELDVVLGSLYFNKNNVIIYNPELTSTTTHGYSTDLNCYMTDMSQSCTESYSKRISGDIYKVDINEVEDREEVLVDTYVNNTEPTVYDIGIDPVITTIDVTTPNVEAQSVKRRMGTEYIARYLNILSEPRYNDIGTNIIETYTRNNVIYEGNVFINNVIKNNQADSVMGIHTYKKYTPTIGDVTDNDDVESDNTGSTTSSTNEQTADSTTVDDTNTTNTTSTAN